MIFINSVSLFVSTCIFPLLKMGNSIKTTILTEDLINEYTELTYLTRSEVLYLFKKFYAIGPELMEYDFHYRFHQVEIVEAFPELKYNPFLDRIFHVFSKLKDNCFSFEDMLDLCSVMSKNCPTEVKGVWAFRIYDLDEDKEISTKDMMEIIDRLTYDGTINSRMLNKKEKSEMIDTILQEFGMETLGSFGPSEFFHLISKVPDFKNSFYFKI